MPFNLSNASTSFQGYIIKILTKKLDILVIVYLDYIFIYVKDPGQLHIDAISWVFAQLRRNGLFINLKQCRFYPDEFHLLGFMASAQGVSMEEERIQVVKT